MAAGHTDMANLITRDGTQTRQQVQQSEDRVKQKINNVQTEVVNEAKRERLLRSLKYESMNARRTGLSPAHKATYMSIFDSLDKEASNKEFGFDKVAMAWKGFVKWLQSDDQVFWIQGKPGSGKSTLLKFIVQHEKTQLGIDRWSPNTLIVSHFFWKPGKILQRNLRGMLCSLNHQLLSSDHMLVGYVLSEFIFAGEQDTVGDWEITQLKSVLHCILEQCNRSVCFIIDGLDEATETEHILQLIDSLLGLPNVKLCVSSRGEDVFSRKFSECDGFKLEALTKEDMLKFVLAEIPETYGSYPWEFLYEVRRLLVEKAEGVFLWLVLALESVKRGLRNNDGQGTIHSRLEKLPSDLENLYEEMWDRLGEDKAIYQHEAARYFALLITNQTLLEDFNQGFLGRGCDFNLTAFHLMLDANEALKRKMLNVSCQCSISEMDKACEDVALGIPVKTAGLLVKRYVGIVDLKVLRPEYRQLEGHFSWGWEFLHRTLLDFFLQSEVGRNISAQGQTNCIKLDLATIIVCQLRILRDKKLGAGRRWMYGDLLYYCLQILGRSVAQDSTSEGNRVADLLNDLESLFAAGLMPWDYRPDWYPPPLFDLLLLLEPAFEGLLRLRIESRDASHATLLLREAMRGYMIYGMHDFIGTWSHFDIEASISTLGPDINLADICLYDSHMSPGRSWHEPGSFEFAPYESISSAAIKTSFSALFYPPISEQLMGILLAVLEREPDLDRRTSFVFKTGYMIEDNKDIAFSNCPPCHELLLGEYHPNEDEGVQLLATYEATVISEVNLRYLMDYILQATPSGLKHKTPLIIRAQHLLEAESSKPHIRPRFFTEVRWTTKSELSRRCYRFTDHDSDILADNTIAEATVDGYAEFGITYERLQGYRKRCERVHHSALSVLADERLGVCRLADMGIKPPS